MNKKLTNRERGLIKGALRRIFARSDLRNEAINKTIMKEHIDTTRPRVKTWCRCPECKLPQAKSNLVVDHIKPIVGIMETFESMSLDEFVDRLWCDISNLSAICYECHDIKTKEENKLRRAYKKLNKKP